jgi:hypothetical protein
LPGIIDLRIQEAKAGALEVDTNVLAKIITSAERFIATFEGARMRCGK